MQRGDDGVRRAGTLVRPTGRYVHLTLAAYVGEAVIIRYDPRDMAEIRIFHDQRFLCRAICAELAGNTIALRDIIRARNRRRRELRHTLQDRARTVEVLLEAHRGDASTDAPARIDPLDPTPEATPERIATPRLKRYIND